LVFLRLKRLWEEHRERQFQVSDKRWIQREAFLEILRDRGQKKQVRESLKQSRIFRNALIVYAKHYGLLGAFEEDFLGKPVLPGGKTLVAPEALIDKHGRLKRVNPATEGKELLLEVLEPTGLLHPEHSPSRPLDDIDYMVAYETMALPSEMRFALRDPDVGSNEGYVEPPQLVPWEEIKRYFGALLILDDRAPDGVSVLCTREPLRRWEISFRFFPSLAAPSGRLQLDDHSYDFLNQHLEDVSPRAFIGKDGNPERGWRYRSLLQAMYVMLLFDLTEDNTIKKCQSRGCPNYFRIGSQSKSRYCSERCANRASTRKSRGQEP